MDLSDRHRHFLRIEQGVVAGVINVVINGVIAWAILHSHAQIPLWGDTSMGIDLLATGFLLPFISCLIVSRIVRSQVGKGKLPALQTHQLASRGLHHRALVVRAAVLGAAGVVLAAAPLVILLDMASAQPVALWSFVGFKAVWAGLLALVISPIMAWWALAAASHEFATT